jgi:gliding motility-associated lipoprotein GldD
MRLGRMALISKTSDMFHLQSYWFLAFCFLGFSSCNDDLIVPKPRIYPRIVYPNRAENQLFKTDFCAFTCELPSYATVVKDELFFDEKPKDECWFNVEVKDLNAKIFCSYYPIRSRAEFDELVSDAFEMVNKHNVKATSINQQVLNRADSDVHGIVFDIEGPVASTYQFFLTDSTKHFLRGALYFETQARPDSLAPVIDFMKDDVNTLVSTLRWRN